MPSLVSWNSNVQKAKKKLGLSDAYRIIGVNSQLFKTAQQLQCGSTKK